jgi:hypothetical protein
MDNSPTTRPPPPDGELYLTVSTLIEREKLKSHEGLYEAFSNFRNDAKNRRTIERAVQPMFEDIADRKRHIFFDEHLIDAEVASVNHSRQADLGSLITLEIPQTIKWLTEEQRWQFDAGNSWELPDVTCRFFWFLHSNRDVSYHISLRVPYNHDAKHYYALSLLQKIFYPSEQPDADCMEKSFGINVVATDVTPQQANQKQSLAGFLESKFKEHMDNILPGRDGAWWIELAHEKSAHIHRPFFTPEFSRAAFLLKDNLFDETLRNPGDAIEELARRRPNSTSPSSAGNSAAPQMEPLANVYRDVDVEGLSTEGLALIFLSGFLQNIIDFLEQDKLEYSDAIEPLHPQGDLANDPHFLLYVTEHSIFEIVAFSRSLDKGSKYIGTCPYLFLVHVTVFHDESLVKQFAESVRRLTRKIGKKTRKFSKFNKSSIERLDEIVSTFHKGRFGIFGEVERYLHINTFLYSTEQAFYKAISDYRYVEGRLDHWDRMLNELSNATGGAHELARQKTERRMDRVLFYITAFSIFQVLFAITQSIGDWKLGHAESPKITVNGAQIDFKYLADALDIGLVIVAIGFVLFAVTEYRRRRK